MVNLKLYQEGKQTGNSTEIMKFDSLEAAVRFGRQCGCGWEARDLQTGTTCNSDEVEARAEEDWYYDETELIWKRNPGQRFMRRLLSIAAPFGDYLPAGNSYGSVCAG